MILPQLLLRFLKHRDDAEFYRLQATDAIRWIEACGIPIGPNTRVLDLGCGHGVFGGQLLKRGCKVTFADESNLLLPEFQSCPFVQVNLDHDSLLEVGKYDLVICSNVLEHLSKPEAFLTAADALLEKDGRFFLSWTNWLSPWGGHEFSPFHYLGPTWGTAVHDWRGKARFHKPGTNLFITYIGSILRHIRTHSRLAVTHRAPRYYTEFSFLLWIPVIREFAAWNCALLLERKSESTP